MQTKLQNLNAPVILHPGEGEQIEFGGNKMTFKVTAEQTGGAFSIVEYEVAPGFVAPPVLHANTKEDWTGFVLEGRIGVEFENERLVVIPAGGFLFCPRNTMFRWWNDSQETSRWICTYVPGGFENYFREITAALAPFPKENFDIKQAMPIVLPLWEKYGIK